MHLNMRKFFDPKLLVRELTGNTLSADDWWRDKEAARAYVREMATGLTLWSTLCVFGTSIAVILAVLHILPALFVVVPSFVCVTCAAIMTAGYTIGARRQLTLAEIAHELGVYFRS